MKICWDNLEGIHLTKNCTLVRGTSTYIYKESCAKCGEPYLMRKDNDSKFCGVSCAHSGENSPMYGKTHTIETIRKISKSLSGPLNPNYRGGVHRLGLTTYDGRKDSLGPYEEIRQQKGTKVLEVSCAYCNRWFSPTSNAVNNRLKAINRVGMGEQRLYCSEECKQACPTYEQKKYPKDHKPYKVSKSIWYTDAELKVWREEVLKRENYICEYCGEKASVAHHNKPKKLEPFFALDPDYGVACCKKCHYKYGHKGECNTANLAHVDCK